MILNTLNRDLLYSLVDLVLKIYVNVFPEKIPEFHKKIQDSNVGSITIHPKYKFFFETILTPEETENCIKLYTPNKNLRNKRRCFVEDELEKYPVSCNCGPEISRFFINEIIHLIELNGSLVFNDIPRVLYSFRNPSAVEISTMMNNISSSSRDLSRMIPLFIRSFQENSGLIWKCSTEYQRMYLRAYFNYYNLYKEGLVDIVKLERNFNEDILIEMKQNDDTNLVNKMSYDFLMSYKKLLNKHKVKFEMSKKFLSTNYLSVLNKEISNNCEYTTKELINFVRNKPLKDIFNVVIQSSIDKKRLDTFYSVFKIPRFDPELVFKKSFNLSLITYYVNTLNYKPDRFALDIVLKEAIKETRFRQNCISIANFYRNKGVKGSENLLERFNIINGQIFEVKKNKNPEKCKVCKVEMNNSTDSNTKLCNFCSDNTYSILPDKYEFSSVRKMFKYTPRVQESKEESKKEKEILIPLTKEKEIKEKEEEWEVL